MLLEQGHLLCSRQTLILPDLLRGPPLGNMHPLIKARSAASFQAAALLLHQVGLVKTIDLAQRQISPMAVFQDC
jgi:hypothetical protein